MGERQFGPYRLVHQIAVGGMAEIHLAKTAGIAGFEKYVALKMIHPNFSQDDQFIQMLIDEAKITVQLQHVNIAQTFDLGRVDTMYYITMEYVDGADLYKLLRKSSERDMPMPVDVAAYIAKEIATGLDYAHRKRDMTGRPLGIVHRDVSPQNVLISHAGEVKLVDFGIAKATMRARQTAVGVIKGKYYYMSPEQAWGDPVDHRTDIFSTGIVLYEMLTGQMLYLEDDLHKLLDMVRRAEIASPTRLRPEIPPQLERIVMHALAKRADDRYLSAGDLATDLERFMHVYAPVFTAHKVSAYFQQVLGEPEPIPAAPVVVPAPVAAGASRVTRRVDREQLLQDRSEFTDENSVIFRIRDLTPPPHDAFGGDTGAMTAPDPLAGRIRRKPRDRDEPTMVPMDDEDADERTVISGPPGFGAEAHESGAVATDAASGVFEADYEPTVLQSAFEQQRIEVELDDDNPTLTHEPGKPRGAVRRKSDAVAPSSGSLRPRSPGMPAHPALLANSPKPAVSAVRPARQSRRTPSGGVPSAPGASLISSIVDAADGRPTNPIRHSDGVPHPMQPQQSQLPVIPAADRSTQLDMRAPPLPSDVSTQQELPVGYHQLPPHLSQMPHAAQLISPVGPQSFPLAPPVVTPDPFRPLGAPPPTFTNQLIALEADAIPDAYKVGRKRSPWILRGALAAACVAIGAVIAVLAIGGGSQRHVESSILVESLPSGAVVVVDGKKLAQKTPVVYREVEAGGRYEIEVKLSRHKLWKKAIAVDEEGQVKVMAYLEPIKGSLDVSSTPAGAEVIVGGSVRGQTPILITDLDRDETKWVELRLRGYRRARQTLEWGDETTLKVHVKLQK